MNIEKLKGLRIAAGLTQGQLASALGYDSSSAVAMIESGARKMPSDKLPALAAALGCTIGELFDEPPATARQ